MFAVPRWSSGPFLMRSSTSAARRAPSGCCCIRSQPDRPPWPLALSATPTRISNACFSRAARPPGVTSAARTCCNCPADTRERRGGSDIDASGIVRRGDKPGRASPASWVRGRTRRASPPALASSTPGSGRGRRAAPVASRIMRAAFRRPMVRRPSPLTSFLRSVEPRRRQPLGASLHGPCAWAPGARSGDGDCETGSRSSDFAFRCRDSPSSWFTSRTGVQSVHTKKQLCDFQGESMSSKQMPPSRAHSCIAIVPSGVRPAAAAERARHGLGGAWREAR